MDHVCKKWNDYLIDKDLPIFFLNFCFSAEDQKKKPERKKN